MAAAKIEAMWDYDMHDNSILVLEKKRGKLSLSEVGDFLRYEKRGSLQGDYVLIIRAGEATCGGSGWMDEVEPKGDQWVLYRVEERERCPVCANLTPYYLYCPECGATLNREKTGQQEPIDRKIGLIKRMQAEMDHRAEVEKKAVELITEGRHGEAVDLLNSLDDNAIARMQAEFKAIETLEAEELSPRQKVERRRQQAKVILSVLAEDVINMNWNQEEEYLKAFMKALKQIEEGGNE